jgi:hypothetical protein
MKTVWIVRGSGPVGFAQNPVPAEDPRVDGGTPAWYVI